MISTRGKTLGEQQIHRYHRSDSARYERGSIDPSGVKVANDPGHGGERKCAKREAAFLQRARTGERFHRYGNVTLITVFIACYSTIFRTFLFSCAPLTALYLAFLPPFFGFIATEVWRVTSDASRRRTLACA